MDKHDFKKLDIERASIAVSVQEARDLVSNWLGTDLDDDSEDSAVPIVTMASSSAGLGFKPDSPATAQSQSKAFERLKRAYKPTDRKDETTNRAPQPASDSDSEGGSRTSSVKRSKRSGMSALDAYKQGKHKKRK